MANDLVPITFLVEQWQVVDGTIDNTVAVATQSADDAAVQTGQRVRRAGWDASARVEVQGELGWPPLDHDLVVALSRSDWNFVRAELLRWGAISERQGDTSGEARDAHALIAAALVG